MTKLYTDPAWIQARILTDGWSVRRIATYCDINVATAARHARNAIPITSVDDLVAVSSKVRDIRSVFSSTSLHGRQLLDEVIESTSYLRGDVDLRQRLWHVRTGRTDPATCKMCESHTKWDRDTQEYRMYCSTDCAAEDDDISLKRRNTNLANRGVDYPAQCPKVRESYKSTMMNRYGVDHVNKHPASVAAREALLDDVFLHEASSNHMTTFDIGRLLGVPQATVSRMLLERGVQWDVGKSAFEQQVSSFVKSITPLDVIVSDRKTIAPLELDITIPAAKLAVECDGLYWHREAIKGRTYHLDKTLRCNGAGINLVHIYDVEWTHQRAIVESRLRHALGTSTDKIYARKCTVVRMPSSEQIQFFNRTHIQSYVPSTYCYGLEYDGSIVAAMSVIKSRYSTKADWELLRYSTELNTAVVGGASKLMRHIVKEHCITSMVSYCDLRYGTGGLYKTLGFNLIGTTSPNYHYFSGADYRKLSRVSFQKHKLASKLKVFDPSLTEYDNMRANGYDRIWDCGNSIWVWQS